MGSDAVRVRPLADPDWDEWIQLRAALWSEESVDEHRDEAERIYGGDAASVAVFVAQEPSGRLVGFAEVSIRPCAEGCESSRVAYLEGWFVQAAVRRRGVGAALVRSCESWGAAQGCVEFASDTESDNAQSQSAHLALGFADVGLVRCFAKRIRP